MSVPVLTAAQRQAAGRAAVEARQVRASTKAALQEGELTMSQVLDRAKADAAVGRMLVADTLQALPQVGKTRALAIMQACRIPSNRRLRGLGHRQRAALTEHLLVANSAVSTEPTSPGQGVCLDAPWEVQVSWAQPLQVYPVREEAADLGGGVL